VVAPAPAAPPAPPRVADPDVVRRATEHLRAFMDQRGIPGLSIAVSHEGVVWAAAYGVSDLETGAPVTTESVFPLGSTSKVLTSLALGLLVEEGRLDLDAPIQTYVPYFPDKGHVITPRQLAGHLAGIRDYDMAAGEYDNTRAYRSIEDAVGIFKDDPLLAPPGTRYQYSAYGFVLLSAAIEGASGREFLAFVQDRILDPLALARTGPNRRASPPAGLVTSYLAGFAGAMKAPDTDVSNKWAAGGFVSTPTEMVRLGQAILAGKVVSAETFALLTTPQRLADGSEAPAGYAMGWRSGRYTLPASGREVRVVHHAGLANGAMSFFVIAPEDDLVVSMQSNLLFKPVTELIDEALAVGAMFLER